MDCKSLQETIAAECRRTEEHVMSTWHPKIIQVFRSEATLKRVKEKKLESFFKSASTLISNQVGSRSPPVEILKCCHSAVMVTGLIVFSPVEIPASEECGGVCDPV